MQGGQSAHYPRPTAKAGRAPARGVAQLPLIGALFGSQVTATKDRRTRPPIRRVGDPPTTPPRPTAKAGRAPARGVAQLPLIGALYGSQVIATKDRRTRPPTRQPVMPKACRRYAAHLGCAGGGWRSPGAVGAIRALNESASYVARSERMSSQSSSAICNGTNTVVPVKFIAADTLA
jgi:hypothetical protein